MYLDWQGEQLACMVCSIADYPAVLTTQMVAGWWQEVVVSHEYCFGVSCRDFLQKGPQYCISCIVLFIEKSAWGNI